MGFGRICSALILKNSRFTIFCTLFLKIPRSCNVLSAFVLHQDLQRLCALFIKIPWFDSGFSAFILATSSGDTVSLVHFLKIPKFCNVFSAFAVFLVHSSSKIPKLCIIFSALLDLSVNRTTFPGR